MKAEQHGGSKGALGGKECINEERRWGGERMGRKSGVKRGKCGGGKRVGEKKGVGKRGGQQKRVGKRICEGGTGVICEWCGEHGMGKKRIVFACPPEANSGIFMNYVHFA